MTKFFKQFKKPTILGPLWALFAQIWAKMNFPGKKGSVDIPIIYHRAKNQKKLLNNFWQKRRTDGRTDRQTDNGDFIGPFVWRGPKKKHEKCFLGARVWVPKQRSPKQPEYITDSTQFMSYAVYPGKFLKLLK